VILNFSDALRHSAQRKPSHPALIHGERTLSYAELDRWVDRLAGRLQALGAEPGMVIANGLGDTLEHVALILAICRVGAVLVVLDVRWTADEKRRAAAHFGARMAVLEPAADPLPVQRCLTIKDLEGDYAFRQHAIDPDTAFVMSLSSGTTGRPKGPRLTHRQFVTRSFPHWVSIGFNEHDRHMVATPMYFGGGRGFTLSHILLGATVVLYPPPYSAEELVEAVARHGITSIFLVPTLLRRLLALPPREEVLMPSLRILLSGGSLLHANERNAALERLSPRFMNLYSSTEGGGVSLLRPEHPLDRAGSVGLPVFMNAVQVVDEHGQRVAAGVIGRIRQRAPWIPDGFFNDPEASAEAFRDGWYYPGDLGALDESGFLSIAGRSKDMLIRGGVNIYPNEIEAVLCEHPAVLDAAVIGRPHAVLGEEPVAFVAARTMVEAAELIGHCRKLLAPYKVPAAIHIIDELPKNSAGKVAKVQLLQTLVAASRPGS